MLAAKGPARVPPDVPAARPRLEASMGVRIEFNGKQYASVHEMPEEERRRNELLM
jgi:hypothetical protein